MSRNLNVIGLIVVIVIIWVKDNVFWIIFNIESRFDGLVIKIFVFGVVVGIFSVGMFLVGVNVFEFDVRVLVIIKFS